jgi:uncharacterized protein (TIGR02231 family)
MLKKWIWVLMAIPYGVFGQVEKVVESNLEAVTVFQSRAQEFRVLKTSVQSGVTVLILQQLSPYLDAQSVQVAGRGPITILGVKHQLSYLQEGALPGPLKAMKDSIRWYEEATMWEQQRLGIVDKEEKMLLSNQVMGGKDRQLTVMELKAMADFFRIRLEELSRSKLAGEAKVKTYRGRITALQNQLNEQLRGINRNTSELHITVSAGNKAAVELEVSMVVANAGWTPKYDIRAMDTNSPITLQYKADVYQNTGADWKNVRLKLSTAHPIMGGNKPELSPWWISIFVPQPPMPQEIMRQSAPAMAREKAMMGIEMEESAKVSDFTQIERSTLSTEFSIQIPYSVASSGKPVTVDIGNFQLPVSYRYSSAPKLDQDVFLQAGVSGWEQYELLPGSANVFFEGGYVGKTFLDPRAMGDTLQLSLGRDKKWIVKREKLKDYTAVRVIGNNKREQFAYQISIRNTKSESVKVMIEDQIPLSQHSEIEVTLSDAGGAKWEKSTGKLVWDLELKPNETRVLVYKFEVKYPKTKQISGL